jgi:DGQHR domain-containing protein
MPARRRKQLRRQALRVEQHPRYPLFSFALTGAELLSIAATAHMTRSDGGQLLGYQRPAVKRHIRNITEYLDSGDVLFPNAIVLALDSSSRFRAARGRTDQYSTMGTLEIPLPKNGDRKPAWVVDGQQRMLALASSRRTDLPILISAFIADDLAVQREQFLRINSVRPLPRGLTTELLPEIESVLPPHLARRRAPAILCDLLNRSAASPLQGLIRRASMSKTELSQTRFSDTTLIKIIQDSLSSPLGCLFRHSNFATDEVDWKGASQVLFVYWAAVRDTFPEAWAHPPTKSRLTHSVGLRAMGRLMDRIMLSIAADGSSSRSDAMRELRKVKHVCHWTSGCWDDLNGMKWNELQNVPAHVRMLSNYLMHVYLSA